MNIPAVAAMSPGSAEFSGTFATGGIVTDGKIPSSFGLILEGDNPPKDTGLGPKDIPANQESVAGDDAVAKADEILAGEFFGFLRAVRQDGVPPATAISLEAPLPPSSGGENVPAETDDGLTATGPLEGTKRMASQSRDQAWDECADVTRGEAASSNVLPVPTQVTVAPRRSVAKGLSLGPVARPVVPAASESYPGPAAASEKPRPASAEEQKASLQPQAETETSMPMALLGAALVMVALPATPATKRAGDAATTSAPQRAEDVIFPSLPTPLHPARAVAEPPPEGPTEASANANPLAPAENVSRGGGDAPPPAAPKDVLALRVSQMPEIPAPTLPALGRIDSAHSALSTRYSPAKAGEKKVEALAEAHKHSIRTDLRIGGTFDARTGFSMNPPMAITHSEVPALGSDPDDRVTPKFEDASSESKPTDFGRADSRGVPVAMRAELATFATSELQGSGASPRPAAPDVLPALKALHATVEKSMSAPGAPARLEIELPMKDGAPVLVRLELRAGEITANFRTDSPELRQALEQAWPQFSQRSQENGLRLGEAKFESPSWNQSPAQGGEDSRREPRNPERANDEPVFGNPSLARKVVPQPVRRSAPSAPASSLAVWA